jgi:hypothetical protein
MKQNDFDNLPAVIGDLPDEQKDLVRQAMNGQADLAKVVVII